MRHHDHPDYYPRDERGETREPGRRLNAEYSHFDCSLLSK
jgi:hypothetical protein